LKKNRHNPQPRENGTKKAAQNLKPAVKTRPPTGADDPVNSTNLIKNRYQQTWHTIEFSNNRHTRHHPNQTFRIAPEQLFKLTRPAPALQINVSAITSFQRISPTRTGTPKSEPFSRPFEEGGWPQTFRISGGDSENNTRPHTNPQIHPNPTTTPPKTPKDKELQGVYHRIKAPARRTRPYALPHISCRPKSAQKASPRTPRVQQVNAGAPRVPAAIQGLAPSAVEHWVT
jgi:hypothetical protein